MRAGQMWADSDCGELGLGFIPGKNHAPPSPSPWEPPRWAQPTASPAVLSRASQLFRPFGRANWLFRWETDRDGGGLRDISGRQGVRKLQQGALRSNSAGGIRPGIWC